MTSRRRVRAMWLGAAASVLLAAPAAAQLQPVQPEDYGRFESLGDSTAAPSAVKPASASRRRSVARSGIQDGV